MLGGLQEALVNLSAAAVQPGIALGGSHIVTQDAPECGLPSLVLFQRAVLASGGNQHIVAVGPGIQPVGAVDLVLVEEIRQPLGQLVVLALVTVDF